MRVVGLVLLLSCVGCPKPKQTPSSGNTPSSSGSSQPGKSAIDSSALKRALATPYTEDDERAAVGALSAVRPEDPGFSEAIAVLFQALLLAESEDDEYDRAVVGEQARKTLAQLGAATQPFLLKLSRSNRYPERALAADLLRLHQSDPALQRLLILARDPVQPVRRRALRALGAWKSDTEVVRDALIRGTRDQEPFVRAAAARSLSAFPLTKNSLGALLRMFSKGGDTTSGAAAESLMLSGEEGLQAIERAIPQAKDPQFGLHGLGNAFVSFTRLDAKGKIAPTKLRDLAARLHGHVVPHSQNPNKWSRLAVVSCLGFTGEALAPGLREVPIDHSWRKAFRLIAKTLIRLLADKDGEVRYEACDAFRFLGPSARPQLETFLSSQKDPQLRKLVKQAIENTREFE